MQASKYCPDCRRRLPIYMFNSDRARVDGLAVYCGPCYAARTKATRLKKIEHYRAVNNAWNKRNPDKMAGYRARRNHKQQEEQAA